jgi:hypothetical protein
MIEDESPPSASATPWEEARGPHLPDAFARIPPLAWVFIVLSVARLWVLVDTARLGPDPDPSAVGGVVANAIGSLAVLLTPAALFIRQPAAVQRAPLLAFGLIAMAIADVMQAMSPGIQPFFDAVTGGSELTLVAPLFLAYVGGAALVALIGLIGVGLGLDRARRQPSRRGVVSTVVVLLVAIILLISRVAEASFLLPSSSDSMPVTVYNLVATGIAIGTILAWAYLVIVTVSGASAGESPALGWRLGVLGGVLGFVAYGMFSVILIVVGPDTGYLDILLLASALVALGPASLFLAVAAGLPSLDAPSPPRAD